MRAPAVTLVPIEELRERDAEPLGESHERHHRHVHFAGFDLLEVRDVDVHSHRCGLESESSRVTKLSDAEPEPATLEGEAPRAPYGA